MAWILKAEPQRIHFPRVAPLIREVEGPADRGSRNHLLSDPINIKASSTVKGEDPGCIGDECWSHAAQRDEQMPLRECSRIITALCDPLQGKKDAKNEIKIERWAHSFALHKA